MSDQPNETTQRATAWQRAKRCIIRWRCEEAWYLLALVLVVGAAWIFAEIADDVMEQETHAFDKAVLLGMRDPGDIDDPWGPYMLEEMGRDFTALGGVAVGLFITAAAGVYLLLRGKWRAALFIALAVGSGTGMSFLLKLGFDRPRPDLVPHGSYTMTASFPSGHSMMSAVIYLTLGALLARLHQRGRVKVYFIVLASVVTLLVGVSRVYLGVHWPTDVLAGWTAGAGWAVLCWFVALLLQSRGQVERDVEAPPLEHEAHEPTPA